MPRACARAHRFVHRSPFGPNGLDIKSFAAGLLGRHYTRAAKRHLPREILGTGLHTHNALDHPSRRATSWSGCWRWQVHEYEVAGDRAGIAGAVGPLVLLGEVATPVLIEVAVADDGAHLEYSLGAVKAPAGAGDVHAVLDQVPAGALDDAGGDRPPTFEGGGIVDERPLADQVGGALVDGRPGGPIEVFASGLASECGGDLGRLTLEDGAGALMACLDAASRHSVGAHHRLQARLPLRPQVQVVLEHLAEQIAALHVQTLVQFAVGELAASALSSQPTIHSNRSREAAKADERWC